MSLFDFGQNSNSMTSTFAESAISAEDLMRKMKEAMAKLEAMRPVPGNGLLDVAVIESPLLPIETTFQTKFPRCHKKKWRVVKKFKKRYTKTETCDAIMVDFGALGWSLGAGKRLMCSPKAIAAMKNLSEYRR